jgi:hypothetical protein
MTPYRASRRPQRVPKSAVTRAPTQTRSLVAVAAILALACLALAAAAALDWTHDAFITGMGALLAGCGAAGVFFGGVLGGSGSAPCPCCGAPIHDIERKARVEGVLCVACNRFLKSKAGVMRPMARGSVAADPIFGAALPMSLAWPPGCIVCGAKATHSVPVPFMKTDSDSIGAGALGLAVVATTGARSLLPEKSRIDLEAPHCAEHDDGVFVTEGGPSDLFLLFRSYPYQRAFCALNETQAVESPATGRDVDYPDEVPVSDPEDVVAGREGVEIHEKG